MIRKAIRSDLSGVKKLTEACATAMQKKGIFQWNEFYPSIERLQLDIDAEELYLLEENNELLAIMVLTPKMDEEYIPVEWLTENGRNLYIHRLATRPDLWGKGYGQQMMQFAEDFARAHDYTSVRLDTFSQNVRNQKFYELRGYTRLGKIYFPKQSEHPFYCYEKILAE